MGRPATLTFEALIQAATLVAARLGPGATSIAAVSKQARVPTGSIYHRVSSRDALLAEIWLAAAERFQAQALDGFKAARTIAEAADASLITLRFARSDHAASVVLNSHRREEFIRAQAPEEYRARAAKLSAELRQGIAQVSARLFPGDAKAKEKVAVALIGIPLGAVRVFLPQAMPPVDIDDTIMAAVRAALGH